MCGEREQVEFENLMLGTVIGFLIGATATMLLLTKWVLG